MFLLLEIGNPFSKKTKFNKIFYFYKRISKFKFFEFESFTLNQTLLKILIDLRVRGRDHAGIYFSFILLGFGLELNFYDSRHWDYKNNCWEK